MCNIGPAEIKRRKQFGWFGVISTLVLLVVLIIFDLTAKLNILLFFPVFSAILGFAQAQTKFCAAYGLQGVKGMKGMSNLQKIQGKEKLDARLKSLQYIILSGVVAAIITVFLSMIVEFWRLA